MLSSASMEYKRVKSAAKEMLPRGANLKARVGGALAHIAKMVGATLGPGGHPVLLERSEWGLPPSITKDGVTVFKHLGFEDPVQQCVLEAARDVATRTATEAGDGTSTASILADAIYQETEKHPRSHQAPQLVRQEIQDLYTNVLAPHLRKLAVHPKLDSAKGQKLLRAVAKISANGDDALAKSVMACFAICGDDGNVTIVEGTGLPRYEEEKIQGYPWAQGFETSCGSYYPAFVNDAATQQVRLEKPMFLLYFGRILDLQTLVPVLQRLQDAWEGKYLKTPNLVVVATGFGPNVLTGLAHNFRKPDSLNVLPLLVPHDSPVHNYQRHLLDDLAALTGGTVFDPVTKPMDSATFEDIGNLAAGENEEGVAWAAAGITDLEMGRYRTSIIGIADPEGVIARADVLKASLASAESELDAHSIRERAAKLTGGIARLRVYAPTTGDTREKRDRAEDAICAVRAALKEGVLPGGCWGLLSCRQLIQSKNHDLASAGADILQKALVYPWHLLTGNVGVLPGELPAIEGPVLETVSGKASSAVAWDAQARKHVLALKAGLVDALPAVNEALKNAISIATQLATLGGVVVTPRDPELERKESLANSDFERSSQFNPAEERP